jgi:hypothetical protein
MGQEEDRAKLAQAEAARAKAGGGEQEKAGVRPRAPADSRPLVLSTKHAGRRAGEAAERRGVAGLRHYPGRGRAGGGAREAVSNAEAAGNWLLHGVGGRRRFFREGPRAGPRGGRIEWRDVFPQLQRFYGGPRDQWGALSVADLVDYLHSKRAIEAEEALRAAAAVALGSGSMKPGNARALRAMWLRQSRVGGRAPVMVRGSAPPLAAMGIAVEVVGGRADDRR